MKNMKNNYGEVNRYALILAGGNGTRLWPISTENRPKQFLNLYDENIMINETIKRIEPLFEHKNIFVIINKNQEEIANRYIDFNIPLFVKYVTPIILAFILTPCFSKSSLKIC